MDDPPSQPEPDADLPRRGASPPSKLTRAVAAGLALLAVTQAGFIGLRLAAPDAPAPPQQLEVGDRLAALHGVDAAGRAATWALENGDGRWTAVLAYHSQCVHCATVAPAWREWLARPHALRVVAVSHEPADAAEAYRAAHGWRVPVLATADGKPGPAVRALTARTPWLFLFDERGVLRHHGHGAGIAALDSLAAPAARR